MSKTLSCEKEPAKGRYGRGMSSPGKSKCKGPAAEKSLAYRAYEKEGDWQG